MSMKYLSKALTPDNSGSETLSVPKQEFLRMSPVDPSRPKLASQAGFSLPKTPPKSLVTPADGVGSDIVSTPPQAVGTALPAFAMTSTIPVGVRSPRGNQRPRRSLLAPPTQLPQALPLQARHVPANLAEVLHQLQHLTSMPRRKHKDTMSAVRTMARVLDRPLQDIPTAPAQLRPLLTKAHPALAEMSPARWTTVCSLLLGSLSELGIEVMPGRARKALTPAWQALFDALGSEAHKKHRCGVSRAVHFFSDTGIAPADVDAAALLLYRDRLLATSLRRDVNPQTTFKRMVFHWSRAAALVPGWPVATATLAPTLRRYALPIEAFPASFAADVTAFLTRSANPDVFSDDYAEPVKDSTSRLRRKQILQLASALVASGTPAERVTSLAVLVDIERAQAALRYLLGRRDGRKGVGIGQQAQLLRTIARHWVKVDPGAVERLRRMVAGLTPKKAGMVAKNRERLRQFDLDANVEVLLGLPARVVRRVEAANTGSHKDALRVMFALAVEILTRAPMRVANLCEFDLAHDLVETRRGTKRHRRISIDEARTKTRVRFEREMAASTSALLDVYLAKYRPRVCDSPGTLLFPGRHGELRALTRFSTAISEFIYRESGLTMNPHLFRHLMIKLHGKLHPGDTETGRLTLGHTTSNTINLNYAENRTDNAFKRWDETLARLRNGFLPSSGHSSNRSTR